MRNESHVVGDDTVQDPRLVGGIVGAQGDAADALLAAAQLRGDAWQVVNAAPEVATIGQVARTVQGLAQDRHLRVRLQGAVSSESGFRVSSRLAIEYRHNLGDGLGEVLDFFVARR